MSGGAKRRHSSFGFYGCYVFLTMPNYLEAQRVGYADLHSLGFTQNRVKVVVHLNI